ncbi:MAG: ABC transporter ATP-binding protein [Dehalococcoidia bacterium]|nr:ABC transporter ATP-binding protein [Dehalococcoidia bacterium]
MLVHAQDVRKRYGKVTVLDGANLAIEAGRVTAVIGANGAGKSTLIKCVVGLVAFDGKVTIDGVNVARRGKEARRRIGYVPQTPAFHGDLSVRETALFYARLKQAPRAAATALVEAAGLEEHAAKPVGALSGGMRQRLALGVALLGEPSVLILDEPAAGLDTHARLELRRLVAAQREAGLAILLSTHCLEDVPYVADDALVLDQGKTVYAGPAAGLASTGLDGSRLFLRLNGHSPEALDLLRGNPLAHDVQHSGEWVVVNCAARNKAQVVEALVAAGVSILDFRVEEAPVDAAVERLQSLQRGLS